MGGMGGGVLLRWMDVGGWCLKYVCGMFTLHAVLTNLYDSSMAVGEQEW